MNHRAYGQQWNTVVAFLRVLVLLLRKAVQVEVGHVRESKLQDAFWGGSTSSMSNIKHKCSAAF